MSLDTWITASGADLITPWDTNNCKSIAWEMQHTNYCELAALLHEINSILQDIKILQF